MTLYEPKSDCFNRINTYTCKQKISAFMLHCKTEFCTSKRQLTCIKFHVYALIPLKDITWHNNKFYAAEFNYIQPCNHHTPRSYMNN